MIFVLGIKDKEALRDLFIKINILSRSPTPEEDILPPLHRLQTHSKGRTDFVVIDGEDGVLNKRKYVREWLVEDKSPETTEKTENHPNRSKSFKTESLKVKMASSIVSKIKLYKVCSVIQSTLFSFMYIYYKNLIYTHVLQCIPVYIYFYKNSILA